MYIIPTVFKQDVTTRQIVHVHVMKARVGWKGTEILYFGARCRRGITSRPARFVHGEGTRYLLERRLGGPHNRSRRFGEQKNVSFPPGISAPDFPTP
jgi:hypothetical protein